MDQTAAVAGTDHRFDRDRSNAQFDRLSRVRARQRIALQPIVVVAPVLLIPTRPQPEGDTMPRQIIRVEPLASLLNRYKAPTSTVVTARRHGVRDRGASVRPGYRRNRQGSWHDSAPDRTGPRADEALPGDGGLFAGERAEMQRLLHLGGDCLDRSTKSTAAIFRSIRRRASSSASPPGTAVSTSKSTASRRLPIKLEEASCFR